MLVAKKTRGSILHARGLSVIAHKILEKRRIFSAQSKQCRFQYLRLSTIMRELPHQALQVKSLS